MAELKFRRILVVGTTGSGKTTTSKRISKSLQLPRVELDSLRWNPGWVETSDEVFIERVRKFESEHDEWVIDGNYSFVRDILWPRADLVIWLDFSLTTIFANLFKRSYDNIRHKRRLCNGNVESIALHLSKKSIFLWALKSYWRRKKNYSKLMKEDCYPNLTFKRVTTPEGLEALLRFLQPSAEEKPGLPSNV